jgi:hypoxanthine phosphoribosyltransferase
LKKELLLSKETIQKRVKELAIRISNDYSGKEPVLIGILNGVIFFFADLIREISIPTKMDFMRAASYGSSMESSGSVRLTKDAEIELRRKHLILVEDIVDTGLTLSYILRLLERREPESLKICALISKIERREVTFTIDYCGFELKEGFVVGYGLDYDENYRYLKDIYLLR